MNIDRTCQFDNCSRPRRKGLLCSRHGIQQASGLPLTPLRAVSNGTEPLAQRMQWRTERTETCWNWTGAKHSGGYGQIRYGNKALYAHRVAWEILNGPVPQGLFIDHICHNRLCVRPDHLQVVTRKQNNENILMQKNNSSGARGVFWNKRRQGWQATVTHNYRTYSAGLHETVAQAEAAVVDLRNRLFTNNLTDRADA